MKPKAAFLSKDQVLGQWQHCMWAHTVSEAQAQELVHTHLQVRHVHAGQYLWKAGDVPTGWTGVTRGAAKICVPTPDGRSITLCGYAGSWFGETYLLRPHMAMDCDAIALHDLTMLTLPAHAFHALRQQSATFSQFLLELMAERSHQLMRLLTAKQCLSVTGRVAQSLGSLITPLNFPFPDAGLLNITQSELADFCQVSRARFNEALLELEKQDLLEVGYRTVRLKDIEGLRRYEY